MLKVVGLAAGPPEDVDLVEYLMSLNFARTNGPQSQVSASDVDIMFDLEDGNVPAILLDLAALSIPELEYMCAWMFREMDEDFPRFGAGDDYVAFRDELQRRSADQAA